VTSSPPPSSQDGDPEAKAQEPQQKAVCPGSSSRYVVVHVSSPASKETPAGHVTSDGWSAGQEPEAADVQVVPPPPVPLSATDGVHAARTNARRTKRDELTTSPAS
jgi:hypothetical protein